MNKLADEAAKKLSNKIDGDVLGEYDQADDSVDDGDLGGTAGNGFTLSVSNINQVFAVAKRKLQKQLNSNFRRGDLFAVISPNFEETLLRYLAGKESMLGDTTGKAGHIGHYYGFDLYVSNSVGWSATLTMGSAMTAGDTITINGVVLTAAASPTNAGDVDVESTAAVQVDTLVASINAPLTTVSGDFIALSQANADKLFGITATDGTTEMTLKAEGWAGVAVSETLTATADVWTTTKQIEHQLFGKKGSTDVVIQARPKIEVKEVPDKLGKNIIPYTLYGLKTFDEGDAGMIDVQTRSDSY